MKKRSTERTRLKILKLIGTRKHGMSVWQVARFLDVPFSWVAPRVTELEKSGVLFKTDERRLNPNSGKNGTVYKVAGSK